MLKVCRNQLIDILFLTETWHDSDSVSLSRLRADGYQVVDRPRPRSRADTLATNHGGVAAVAVPSIRLTRVDVGTKPGTFEMLCVCVSCGSSSCVVLIVYRSGSVTVTSAFFDDLVDVLDRVATPNAPVLVVGNVNIWLDWPTESDAKQFNEVLATYSLPTGSWHQHKPRRPTWRCRSESRSVATAECCCTRRRSVRPPTTAVVVATSAASAGLHVRHQSTRVVLTPTRSVHDCCHHRFVVLTSGGNSILTSSPRFTTMSSQRSSTTWSRGTQCTIAVIPRTHCSMKTVDSPSGLSVGSCVQPRRLIQRMHQPPWLLGKPDVGAYRRTATSCGRSASHSGQERPTVNDRIHVACGSLSTYWCAVAMRHHLPT